jgi:uncharacterized protein (TIGR03437 family)
MRTLQLLVLISLPCSAQEPEIKAVVSSADFKPGATFDGLATILGSNLAEVERASIDLPLPTNLDGTEVLVCGYPVFSDRCGASDLVYVSPTQINAVLRDPGFAVTDYSIVVRRGGVPSSSSEMMASAFRIEGRFSPRAPHPKIFEMGYDCGIDPRRPDTSPCGLSRTRSVDSQPLRGAITDQSGALVTSQNPMRVGRTYTAWITGLTVNKATGLAAPGVSLRFDGLPAFGYGNPVWTSSAPSFAGRSPEFPGLYQVNFAIPANFMGSQNQTYKPHPCADYSWELSLTINQGSTGQLNTVQLPVVVKSGDVECVPTHNLLEGR